MNDAQKKVPGRPRKGAADRTADRQALVEAAFAILREGGPTALTARSVAARVGAAVGSVYTAVEGLETLRLEANVITLGLLRAHLAAALAACPVETVEGRLLCLAEAYVGFAEDNRAVWAALFEPRTRPAPSTLTEGIAGLFALLEDVLRTTGRLGADEVPVLARALWSSVHGTVYLAETGNLGPVGRGEASAMVRALVGAVVRGIGEAPGGAPANLAPGA